MSDSQAHEPVTVSADGVSVAKRFEADEFPVPAIAFRIQSRRSEAVTVRLVDDVPEDVAVEDLGFHPEYGSEHWTIDNDTITFEREIEPEGEYMTVYGIRATGTDDVGKFLTEPRIEMVDPPLGDDEVIDDAASTDVVKDVIAGDSDSVPGLDGEDDEEIETLDLEDPNSDGTVATAEDETGDAEGGAAHQSVTAALVAELKRDSVDDEVRAALRDELGVEDTSGSVDARLEHLQSEVSELTAYTEALERFLDEQGAGDELIEEFQDQLESVEDELARISDEQTQTDERIEEVDDRVQTVAEELADVQSEVEGVRETVEAVDDDVAALESEMPDEERINGVIDDRLGEIEAQLEDELDGIQDDIEDLKQWREQLSSVIGGGE